MLFLVVLTICFEHEKPQVCNFFPTDKRVNKALQLLVCLSSLPERSQIHKVPLVTCFVVRCVLCCTRTVGQAFMLLSLSRRTRRRWWQRCSGRGPTLTRGWCRAGCPTEPSQGPKTPKSSDKWWGWESIRWRKATGCSFYPSFCLISFVFLGDWWVLQ